jgi:hypothetical protein
MQDITKNIPYQYQNGNPPGDHLEGPDGIDAVWITPDHFVVSTRVFLKFVMLMSLQNARTVE